MKFAGKVCLRGGLLQIRVVILMFLLITAATHAQLE